jgi:hypothetical protein
VMVIIGIFLLGYKLYDKNKVVKVWVIIINLIPL